MSLRLASAFAAIAVIGVFVVGGYAQRRWSQATDDNCERIHRVVVAGELILDGESQLRYAREHRTISRAEYEAQLERFRLFRPLTERNLEIWRSGDCTPTK